MRRSVTTLPNVAVGRERHPRRPQRLVGRVGGDDRDLDVDVLAPALLVARDDPPDGDRARRRPGAAVALQALAGLDHRVGAGLLEAQDREVGGDRRVERARAQRRMVDARRPPVALVGGGRDRQRAAARGAGPAASVGPGGRQLMHRSVLYAPWRIERASSARQAIRGPSCSDCWPATPRSRSSTSRPTRNAGAAVGDLYPGLLARLRRPALRAARRGRPRRSRPRVLRAAARREPGARCPTSLDHVGHVDRSRRRLPAPARRVRALVRRGAPRARGRRPVRVRPGRALPRRPRARTRTSRRPAATRPR